MKRIVVCEPYPSMMLTIDGANVDIEYSKGWVILRSDRIIRKGRKRSTVRRACRMRAREFRDLLGDVIEARNNGKGAKKR